MNKEIIHTEAENVFSAITEQFSQIQSYRGPIPLIELDIILGNIAKLYEQINRLKKINGEAQRPGAVPILKPLDPLPAKGQDAIAEPSLNKSDSQLVTFVKEKSPIVSFVVRPSFVADALVSKTEPIQSNRDQKQESIGIAPDNKSITGEMVPNQVNEVVTENPNISTAPKAEALLNANELNQANDIMEEKISSESTTVVEAKPILKEESRQAFSTARKATIQSIGLFDSVTTVAGQYEEQPTLHDKISKNKSDSSLGKKFQNKPVDDLKKSIGINEKFAFINELFEGDLNSYNNTIDSLNKCLSLEEANYIISKELLPRYHWDQKGKACMSLLDLIERRFTR